MNSTYKCLRCLRVRCRLRGREEVLEASDGLSSRLLSALSPLAVSQRESERERIRERRRVRERE